MGGFKVVANQNSRHQKIIGDSMDLNHLSAKQQWALLLTLAILLASPYAIKRFWPAYQTLAQNQQRLAKDQDTIKNPKFPESPAEDEEDILADLEDLEMDMQSLRSQTNELQSRIAPIDSQDVLLELSAAARLSNVNIIENVPYMVQRVAKAEDKTKPAGKAKAAAKPTSKFAEQYQQRLQRRSQRQGNRGANQAFASKGMVGAIPRQGELIYDVVNNLDEARPLQMLVVQGTYFGLMSFIESIKSMPTQVTLLNINIDTQIQSPSQGLPQIIRVNLIVAL
jgi:hypothetical protein